MNLKYPEVNYGPLIPLIGTWKGDKGMDIAPEPDGIEENPYYETIIFEEAGDLKNGEEQQLSIVRYLQIVKRKSNDEVFHDQTGYWMWDSATNTVMHSIAIPRGLTLLAGGEAKEEQNNTMFNVKAKLDDEYYTIVQSPFLNEKAKTTAFEMNLNVGKDTISYHQTTFLEIYGRSFDHTDENTLKRID